MNISDSYVYCIVSFQQFWLQSNKYLILKHVAGVLLFYYIVRHIS